MRREKHLGIRVDGRPHKLLVCIAGYEGCYLRQAYIRSLEKEYSPVQMEDLE